MLSRTTIDEVSKAFLFQAHECAYSIGDHVCLQRHWKLVEAGALRKPGHASISNTRLIVKMRIMHKLYCRCIYDTVKSMLIHKLHPAVYGIHKGDRCVFIHTKYTTLARKSYKWRLPMAIATLDISRAFATVPLYAVLKALEYHGAPEEIISLIATEIKGNKLRISVQPGESFDVDLQRGILEGSPLSMVLILLVQSMLVARLLANTTFVDALAVLPSAPNSSSVRVDPTIWVDDFVLAANSSNALQRQIELIEDLLGQLEMDFKLSKIHWMSSETLMAQEIFVRRQSIQKEKALNVLGLQISSDGSPQTSIDQRRTAALAKWFSLDKEARLQKLSIDTIFRLHNQTFIPAMSYGLAALALTSDHLRHLARSSTTHLLRYYRRPPGAYLPAWIQGTRAKLKAARLSGELMTPVKCIASDLRALHRHCSDDRGSQLRDILEWRCRAWQSSVNRNNRPQMKRGGDFIELTLLDSQLAYFGFLRRHVA